MRRFSVRSYRRLNLALAVIFSLAAPASAIAIPTAMVTYIETSIGGAAYQYDYTLINTSSPALNLDVNLYDVFVSFDAAQSVNATVPVGWNEIHGTGFVELFSTSSGIPPTGNDIGPGLALAGFQLSFAYRAGALAFDALFTNPSDVDNPLTFAGVTEVQSPSPGGPVPEPNTVLLIASAVLCCGAIYVKGKRRGQTLR